jgi:predicted DNA-binding ribbon-helix-helix protein
VNDLLDWSTPEFRTVATPDGRKGIRLERAFWHALGVIGLDRGLKRDKVISDVMQEANDRQINVTSAIRSFVVHTLASDLERTRQLCGGPQLVSLLLQTPVPAFAVDRNKRLIKVNGDFSQFLRSHFAEIGDSDLRRGLQINLETPISQIFDELGHSRGSRECVMAVAHETRLCRVRTRLVAIPPHDPTALVGYVVP